MFAQESFDITFEDSHLRFGVYASGYGNGLFFRNATAKNDNKSLFTYEFNFGNIKHSREKKILNNLRASDAPFVFNKTNRIYVLRSLFGFSKTLSAKGSKSSLGVNVFAAAGPLIGFKKPVFIEVAIIDTSIANNSFIESQRYDPSKTNPSNILGQSNFSKGIGQTKLLLGLSFKSGISFDWGNYRSDFRSIEAGIMIDYLPSRPEIIYGIKNKVFFSGFYISFAFGKNY